MKISLIVPYFGTWPPWFPAFLISCKYNPRIGWIFFTDCDIPPGSYDNIRFIPGSLNDLNLLATQKLGYEVSILRPYKICDLRPAFGIVFEDYLADSIFWGHCDVDVVWGDIRKFITNEILESYDVISARKHHIAGHFTLYRNTQRTNSIYTLCPIFRDMLNINEHTIFDERGMTQAVRHLAEQNLVSVYWPKYLLNFARQKSDAPSRLHGYTEGWYWKQGKLYDQTDGNEEIMYLHFMPWKDTLKYIDFDYTENPEAFHITSTSIQRETADSN